MLKHLLVCIPERVAVPLVSLHRTVGRSLRIRATSSVTSASTPERSLSLAGSAAKPFLTRRPVKRTRKPTGRRAELRGVGWGGEKSSRAESNGVDSTQHGEVCAPTLQSEGLPSIELVHQRFFCFGWVGSMAVYCGKEPGNASRVQLCSLINRFPICLKKDTLEPLIFVGSGNV